MKIISWNVNSLRARFERTCALLKRHEPDVLCLQETKLLEEQFPLTEFQELGYHAVALGQKSYNGVAILSRIEPLNVVRGFPGDPSEGHARVIGAEFGGIQVFDLYVVNGKSVEHPDYQLKLQWLDAFDTWLTNTYDPATPLLLTGDFNIAPDDIDVYDPEAWRGKNLFSEPERQRLHGLFGGQLQDLYRQCYPDDQRFTWWDYRNGAFHKNLGLRIDLALATSPVAERCIAVEVDREERKPSTGEGKPSDHAPVIVTLRD